LLKRKWNGIGKDENGNITYELTNGNGKIKEYNDKGILIFEGEYLNGKKNGSGKEYYDNGNFKFDGEYLNGKEWTGKIYDENSNITELIDGKGYYKSYNNKGVLQLEYEILNGEIIGKVKNYYDNGNLQMEGQYRYNMAIGNCKKYFESGKLKYEGDYFFGRPNGKGIYYYENGQINKEGEFLFSEIMK